MPLGGGEAWRSRGALEQRPAHVDRVHNAIMSLEDFEPKFLARLRVRFFAKVSPEPMSGCHLWTGAVNSAGYGSIGVGSRGHGVAIVRAAHRIAYLLEFGTVADGMVLDHLCRNPACVNPRHLEPVTHDENVRRGHASVFGNACKRGHPRIKGNFYTTKTGAIHCTACQRANHAARKARGAA